MSRKSRRSVSALAGLTLAGVAAVSSAPAVHAQPPKSRDARPPAISRQACNVGIQKENQGQDFVALQVALQKAAQTYKSEVSVARKMYDAGRAEAQREFKSTMKAARGNEAKKELAVTVRDDMLLYVDSAYWTSVDSAAAKYEKAYNVAYATYYAAVGSPEEAAARSVCLDAVTVAADNRREAIRNGHRTYSDAVEKARSVYRSASKKKSAKENRSARKVFRDTVNAARKSFDDARAAARETERAAVDAAETKLKEALEAINGQPKKVTLVRVI